jgi:hypothetical protein
MGAATKTASRQCRLHAEHYTRKCIMATDKIAVVDIGPNVCLACEQAIRVPTRGSLHRVKIATVCTSLVTPPSPGKSALTERMVCLT